MLPSKHPDRYRYAVVLWIVAVLCLLASELLVLRAQLHGALYKLSSIMFWRFPILITLPLLMGTNIYRTVSQLISDDDSKATDTLGMWSYYLAILVMTANGTALVCLLAFL
jgi:hypothetical protein